MIGMREVKIFAIAAVIGGSAFALPKAFEHNRSADEARLEALTDNPFAASAVQAATPVIDVATQIALATPAGQIAQAVVPVIAPVAVAAAEAVTKPKPVRKPQPVAEPRDDMAEADKMQNLWVCDNKTVEVEIDVPDPVKPVERSSAGMLLGGAGGALLGSQIGGGNGKILATVASAAGGAWAGDRMANSAEPNKQTTHKEKRAQVVEVCGWQAVRLPDEVLHSKRDFEALRGAK